jgi:hypothetical protein
MNSAERATRCCSGGVPAAGKPTTMRTSSLQHRQGPPWQRFAGGEGAARWQLRKFNLPATVAIGLLWHLPSALLQFV